MERTDLMRCACGARLDVGVQPPVSTTISDLTAFITNAVYESSSATEVRRAHARDWIKLVRYLGAFSTENPRPTKPGQPARLAELCVAAAHVDRAARILENWPHGLRSLLHRARSHEEMSDRLPRAFGPIYMVLYRQLSAPSFQFLRDEFEAYLNDHWQGLLCRRNRSLGISTIDAHPRASIRRVAELAQTTMSTAERFVQSKTIGAYEKRSTTGRRFRTVDAAIVSSLSANVPDFVTLSEGAVILALPVERVRQLLTAGMLNTTSTDLHATHPHQAGTQWKICKSSLATINSLVNVQAEVKLKHVDVRHAARNWHLNAWEFCCLVSAIKCGDLVVHAVSPEENTLGAAILKVQPAKAFIQHLRQKSQCTLSVDHAARLLQIKRTRSINHALVQ